MLPMTLSGVGSDGCSPGLNTNNVAPHATITSEIWEPSAWNIGKAVIPKVAEHKSTSP